MPETYREFCKRIYRETYATELDGSNSERNRLYAQRKAIDKSLIEGLLHYPTISEEEIWNAIALTHKINVAQLGTFGIPDAMHEDVMSRCLSAHQSWIKAGGHSFERFISETHSDDLYNNEIRFVLQSELTQLIKTHELVNTEEDIQGLKSWGKDFDLYAIQTIHGECHVFGCIQSKTSIRDRVGRDVTFSHNAMDGLFWSVAITLDGTFLNMPEFVHMVNGGGSYSTNGWHGMYAMSGITENNDRIYKIDDSLSLFIDHAVLAARQFIADRRQLSNNWIATN